MARSCAAARLLVISLCAALPCWSQQRQPTTGNAPSTFYISGSVRNSDDNRPLEMIRIDLKRITAETLATSFTRSNGEFEFGSVPRGSYQIVIEVNGYEPLRENIEIINMSRPGLLILLTPKREFPVQPVAGGPSVSTHELSLPRKAQDAFQKGLQRLYDKDDPKGGIEQFQKAISAAPGFYEAYFETGIAYAHLSQFPEAEVAFRKSIELSQGRYARSDFALAALLSNNGHFSDAEPLARRGLEFEPTAWQGHFELARALAGSNQWAEAEKHVLEARKEKPDEASVYLLLANVHIRKKDYPALVEDLETYLKLNPNGGASAQARSTLEQIRKLQDSAKGTRPNPQP